MNPSLYKPTIFLVDDDPDEQLLLRTALERITISYRLRIAIHGKHLLDLLSVATDRELPCLIVLDSNMPVMNGKETLRQLKRIRRLRNIPTIIYSTSDSATEKEEYLSLGASSFITKPDTIQGISNVAKLMLERCRDKVNMLI